jgi:isopenicillin N synthase-like dioxygenase
MSASEAVVKAGEEKKDRETERAAEMAAYPTIMLRNYLTGTTPEEKAQAKKDCATIAELLHQYGFLIVQDPRVTMEHNDTFIDTLEKYYGQSDEKKAADIRKELHYQVGITPEKVEKARNHCERIGKLSTDEKPLTLCPPEVDKKLRFFWRIGQQPPTTEFKQLNADPVLPADFPEWPKVMNTWGELIMQTVHTVAEMAAEGFELPKETFTNKMKFAPHLLAPTGSDFNKYGDLGNILASYHYDLNFLTIHGRSRFPGLFIWTRSGKKLMVKVPPGCLLLQAGKQFEWLTGGHVLAGFHEVVVAKETVAAIEKAREEKRSLWRVSSTLFGHIASDQVLEPLGKFATLPEALTKYPPTKAGNQVQQELNAIKLGQVAAGETELVAAM